MKLPRLRLATSLVLCLACAGAAAAQRTKLLASDRAPSNQFGSALDIEGVRLVVGSPGDTRAFPRQGVAYVFQIVGGAWVESAKLASPDLDSFAEFGWDVSLDRTRLVVGARGQGEFDGAAYVFEFDGVDWRPGARLRPTTPEGYFGWSVSLDGDRIVVGAQCDSDVAFCAGAVYVFDFDGARWNRTAKLHSSEPTPVQFLGSAVALSGDRLAVTAPGSGDGELPTGAVYIFEFDGSAWSETAKITPFLPTGQDAFGQSIALEGNRLAVGASLDDTLGLNAGAAYVYELDGDDWEPVEKLIGSGVATGDNFGGAVDLDRDVLVIGGVGSDGPPADSGRVWFFRFDGDEWSERGKVRAPDRQSNDGFGAAVAADRARLLAGAPGDDDLAGSAWVFDFRARAAAPW